MFAEIMAQNFAQSYIIINGLSVTTIWRDRVLEIEFCCPTFVTCHGASVLYIFPQGTYYEELLDW